MAEFLRRYTASPDATTTQDYLRLVALSLGCAASLCPLLALLRLRAEEVDSRAELLLAAPVHRLRWAGGHLLAALAGSAAITVVSGFVLGVAAGSPALPGTLVQVPAMWNGGGRRCARPTACCRERPPRSVGRRSCSPSLVVTAITVTCTTPGRLALHRRAIGA